MKVSLTIPDPLVDALDRVAARLYGGNRSLANAKALEPFLREHGEKIGGEPDRLAVLAQSAAELVGAERVEQALRELGREQLAAAAGGDR